MKMAYLLVDGEDNNMAIIRVSEELLIEVPAVFDLLVDFFDTFKVARVEHYPTTVHFYVEKKDMVPAGYEQYEVIIAEENGKLKIKEVREV